MGRKTLTNLNHRCIKWWMFYVVFSLCSLWQSPQHKKTFLNKVYQLSLLWLLLWQVLGENQVFMIKIYAQLVVLFSQRDVHSLLKHCLWQWWRKRRGRVKIETQTLTVQPALMHRAALFSAFCFLALKQREEMNSPLGEHVFSAWPQRDTILIWKKKKTFLSGFWKETFKTHTHTHHCCTVDHSSQIKDGCSSGSGVLGWGLYSLWMFAGLLGENEMCWQHLHWSICDI